MNSSERYGLVSRLLHWTMAVLIFCMIGIGAYMTDLERGDALRSQLYGLHKSIGVTLLILALVRIIWVMLISSPPPPPKALKRIEVIIAKSVIGFMYMLIVLIPLAGYLLTNAADRAVSYFGLFNLPLLMGKSHYWHELLEEAHGMLAFALLALVALHVAGALKHRFLSKDPAADVLKRML